MNFLLTEWCTRKLGNLLKFTQLIYYQNQIFALCHMLHTVSLSNHRRLECLLSQGAYCFFWWLLSLWNYSVIKFPHAFRVSLIISTSLWVLDKIYLSIFSQANPVKYVWEFLPPFPFISEWSFLDTHWYDWSHFCWHTDIIPRSFKSITLFTR